MRKIFLTLIIIFAQPTISKSQKSIETEYQICIKALDFIKAKDVEGLKGLIYKNAFKNTTDEKSLAAAGVVGADATLKKPFESDALFAIVNDVLQRNPASIAS
jgi:hypothetical protein